MKTATKKAPAKADRAKTLKPKDRVTAAKAAVDPAEQKRKLIGAEFIAVFQEALRYYPPAATGLARVVPAGGDRVSGYYVPGGASVYVSMHAMGHSQRNWRDPDAFVPERWLGDERYADDKRASHQPFSFGPRNCIGKT